MSKLKIHEWSGRKREVEFAGYNRGHSACLVRDEQGDRRALTLPLPKLFHIHFRQNPIAKTNSAPLEINRVALHFPACFASIEEKEAYSNPSSDESQTALMVGCDGWKVVTPHKHWLEPRHDQKLSRLLRWELNKLRRQFTIHVNETDEKIAEISNKLAALSPAETVDTKQEMERLEQQIKSLKNESSIITRAENGGFKHISVFEITLDVVRQGWHGLRERLLEMIEEGPRAPSGHMPFTPAAKKALELSLRGAVALLLDYVGTEHLLLGIACEGSGAAGRALAEVGATTVAIERGVAAFSETRYQLASPGPLHGFLTDPDPA